MNKVLVSPSILSADFSRLGSEVASLEQAGADWIHVDVMDGNFVPNITFGPCVLAACRPHTDLPLDVHLMVDDAIRYIPAFAEAGADIIMLDNMDPETMKEAVALIAGRAQTECSGNVTAEKIAQLRDIGVDYISSGALTHSSPILDLSLKHLRPVEA